MSGVFLKLLNLSLSAGYLVLAVVILRLALHKAPKWIRCILWATVGLRLIFPFSVESVFSLLPTAQAVTVPGAELRTPIVRSGFTGIDSVVNPVIHSAMTTEGTPSATPRLTVTDIAGIVWLVGLVAMLLYALISALKIKTQVGVSVKTEPRVYACDAVKSPFILGIIHPKIYIPSDLDAETAALILSHEKAHIKRCDHIWKPLGYLLLSIYWFQPLLWLGYILLCRDIELSCDEKVIQKLGREEIAAYSEALLRFSAPKKRIRACPIAFGEVGVKERLKYVLNYKKPAFGILVISVIACVVTAVCFLTVPRREYRLTDEAFCQTADETELSVSDANRETIADLLNQGTWIDETPNCSFDYRFFFRDQTVQYHSDCGTLYNEAKGKSMTLSEQDKKTVNAILLASCEKQSEQPSNTAQAQTTVVDETEATIGGDDSSTLVYTWAVACTSEGYDRVFFDQSLNPVSLQLSSVRHLPLFRFDDKARLDGFKKMIDGILSVDQAYDEIPSFSDTTAHCTDSFFEENNLFLCYVVADSGSLRHRVINVTCAEGCFLIEVSQSDLPESGTDDTAGFFLLVEVKKADVQNCTVFDAVMY